MSDANNSPNPENRPENSPENIIPESSLSAEKLEEIRQQSADLVSNVITGNFGSTDEIVEPIALTHIKEEIGGIFTDATTGKIIDAPITISGSVNTPVTITGAMDEVSEQAQDAIAALQAEASKPKLIGRQYFVLLRYKLPPLSYSIKPENIFDNNLLKELTEKGAKFNFKLSFADELEDLNTWMKGQRQEVYRRYGMEKIEGAYVFTALNPNPVYKMVAEWREEADKKLTTLAKESYDSMVESFKKSLVDALESNMKIHRSREGLDDIPTLAKQVADEFCGEKFTGIGDWKRGCGVQNAKIGLFFNEIVPEEFDEDSGPGISDDPDQKIAQSELFKSQVAMTLDGLRDFSPNVAEKYFQLEIEASTLYSDEYRVLADAHTLPFNPILDEVRSEIFDYAELTNDEIPASEFMVLDGTVTKEALVAVRGVKNTVLAKVQMAIDTRKSKRKYKNAHVNIKADAESCILVLDSTIDRWAKLLDMAAEQVELEMIEDDQIITWLKLLPVMRDNVNSFLASAEAQISADEAEAAKPKKPRGRPKKKTAELFATEADEPDDTITSDTGLDEADSDNSKALENNDDKPVVNAKPDNDKPRKLTPVSKSAKTRKLGAKGKSAKAKKLKPDGLATVR